MISPKKCKKCKCSGHNKRTCPENATASAASVVDVTQKSHDDENACCIDLVTRKVFGWTPMSSSNVQMSHILGGTVPADEVNEEVYRAVERNFTPTLPNMYCLVCRKFVKVKTPQKWVFHQQSRAHTYNTETNPVVDGSTARALAHIDHIYRLAEK